MNKTAVFAGTFDPFTIGHYDILERAAKLFDKIYVAVAEDTGKTCRINSQLRAEIAKTSLSGLKNVEVKVFSGLLTDLIRLLGADCIIRGIRNAADLEHEKQLYEVYKSQLPNLEVIYLLSGNKYNHVSSSIVKELASLGGNFKDYVHKNAFETVSKLYKQG